MHYTRRLCSESYFTDCGSSKERYHAYHGLQEQRIFALRNSLGEAISFVLHPANSCRHSRFPLALPIFDQECQTDQESASLYTMILASFKRVTISTMDLSHIRLPIPTQPTQGKRIFSDEEALENQYQMRLQLLACLLRLSGTRMREGSLPRSGMAVKTKRKQKP